MEKIILRAVKRVSEKHGIPEEEVWKAALKLKKEKIEV